MTAITSRKK